eukprot:26254-Eustigmatos_ZCMA.PRE.1
MYLNPTHGADAASNGISACFLQCVWRCMLCAYGSQNVQLTDRHDNQPAMMEHTSLDVVWRLLAVH